MTVALTSFPSFTTAFVACGVKVTKAVVKLGNKTTIVLPSFHFTLQSEPDIKIPPPPFNWVTRF